MTRTAAALRAPLRGQGLAVLLCAAVFSPSACRPHAEPAPGSAAGGRTGPATGPETPSAPDSPPPAEPEVHDPESRELLDRIVRAERTVAYHGVRTTVYGPEGTSRTTRLTLVHTAEGRTWMEWTPANRDEPRRKWTTSSRFAWVGRPDLLLRHYRVVLVPDEAEPVAWRPTRKVRIAGRRPGRPSLDLLVDAETWVVLADTWRTADGTAWLRGRFDDVAFGELPEGPAPGPAEALLDGEAAPPEGFAPLDASPPLPGFERIRARTTSCGQWAEEFSDGLAAYSVRQGPASPEDPAEGEVRRKRWLGGGALTTRIGGRTVVVDGGLGDADLQTVLASLRPPRGR